MVRGGFFISLEGVEGAGKSTQARLLADKLTAAGYAVCLTREPGGTPLAEELRRLVKHPGEGENICPETELLLMCASRAQLVRQVILPHLNAGGVVVCDRFADSTTVYQGYARGLDLTLIASLHTLSTGGRWPDLTLVLDLPVETGFSRIARRAEAIAAATRGTDRFEAEAAAFHHKVRAGFADLARRYPERVKLLLADCPTDALHFRVLDLALAHLRNYER